MVACIKESDYYSCSRSATASFDCNLLGMAKESKADMDEFSVPVLL
jgi:hypothetical protein